MKKAVNEYKGITVNRHNDKVEIIIEHENEKVRVLCDKDGIHIGSISKIS